MTKCGKCGSEFARDSQGVVVDRHDCRYVRAVNELVEDAYAFAVAHCHANGDPVNVTKLFHFEMERRTREAGLRR